jgi:hypothetical protein
MRPGNTGEIGCNLSGVRHRGALRCGQNGRKDETGNQKSKRLHDWSSPAPASICGPAEVSLHAAATRRAIASINSAIAENYLPQAHNQFMTNNQCAGLFSDS